MTECAHGPHAVEKRALTVIPAVIALVVIAFILSFGQCAVREAEERTKRDAERQQTIREVCGKDVELRADPTRAFACAELTRR